MCGEHVIAAGEWGRGNDNPRMGNPTHGWEEEKKREICVYEYGKIIRT